MRAKSDSNQNEVSVRSIGRAASALWLGCVLLPALPAQSSPIDGFNPYVIGTVRCAALQRDGKIIIGGSFTSVGGWLARTNIARLNVDGTPDVSFNAAADAPSF